MSVNPINHYALENHPTVYDEESLTALELCARAAAKVNECVQEFNRHAQEVNNELAEQTRYIEGIATDKLPDMVDSWLTAHPEVTTTVQDGAITDAKLHDTLRKLKASYYDSMSAVSADTTLVDGMTVVTLGYYSPKDGGGGIYRITSEESDIPLENGLYAEVMSDRCNAKCWGIRGGNRENTPEIVKRFLNSFAHSGTGTTAPDVMHVGILRPGTIYFPVDKYLLPTLNVYFDYGAIDFCGSVVTFTGDDGIVIEHGFRFAVRNIQMIGAHHGIKVNGQNMEMGELIIEGCRFLECSGTAIYIPYKRSYVATIRNCQFFHCEQVLESDGCDTMVMEKCWISENRKTKNNQGTILLHTGESFIMRDTMFVPYPFKEGYSPTGTAQIITEGVNVLIEHSRFGGEAGSKPAVKISENTSGNVNVVIRDCPVMYCVYDTDAIVSLAGPFRQITIENTIAWYDNMVPVAFSTGVDADTIDISSAGRIYIKGCWGNRGLPFTNDNHSPTRLMHTKIMEHVVEEEHFGTFKPNYTTDGANIMGHSNNLYTATSHRKYHHAFFACIVYNDYATNRDHYDIIAICGNRVGYDIGYVCDKPYIKIRDNTTGDYDDLNITLEIDTENYPYYRNIRVFSVFSVLEEKNYGNPGFGG